MKFNQDTVNQYEQLTEAEKVQLPRLHSIATLPGGIIQLCGTIGIFVYNYLNLGKLKLLFDISHAIGEGIFLPLALQILGVSFLIAIVAWLLGLVTDKIMASIIASRHSFYTSKLGKYSHHLNKINGKSR